MELEAILHSLAQKRPIFHSEADFQHALAWEIQQRYPEASLRLEYKPAGISSRIYLDIWSELGNKKWAIELKYKTRKMEIDHAEESFALLDHSAHDCGRYDFLKDVQRLEQVVATHPEVEGYAIFLSNDNSYWGGGQTDAVDQAFRLPEGREVTGQLSWGEAASPGTMRGREQPISLQGTYRLAWNDYATLDHPRGEFRYLFLKVNSQTINQVTVPVQEWLKKLSAERPVFVSQTDLRDALLGMLEAEGVACRSNVTLAEGLKVDISGQLKTGERFAIEIRYKTTELVATVHDSVYELKSQGAQDISRYDFVSDLVKLEQAAKACPGLTGYAVLITNDHLYWDATKRSGNADEQFRIHHGAVLHGTMQWGSDASAGTRKNREAALVLSGSYPLEWQEYSKPSDDRNGTFHMLIVKIEP